MPGKKRNPYRLSEFGKTKRQRLIEYLSARVGGETVGDTLIRLADHKLQVFSPLRDKHRVSSEDWQDWLRDLGQRINTL